MRRTAQAAFTMMEMVITVSIIAILLAIAIPNMMGYRKNAERDGCQDQMRSILSAIEEARLERDGLISTLKSGGSHSIDDLVPRYLPEVLTCPSGGGAYTVSYDGDRDTFSVACPNAASKNHAL